MKTKYKPTQVALAYAVGSSSCQLFTPEGFGLTPRYPKPPRELQMRVGCFFSEYPKTKEGVGRYWMVHFHHAVVRDKADPVALHKTLMQIPEFRDLCAYDVPFFSQYDE